MNTHFLVQCPDCKNQFQLRAHLRDLDLLRKENRIMKGLLKKHGIYHYDPLTKIDTYGKHIDIFVCNPILPESIVNKEA